MGRRRLEIRGAVQGVGFRPFVHRLARELDLAGWVANDPHGVIVEIEGPAIGLAAFERRLRVEAPPAALLEEVEQRELDPTGDDGFTIRTSEHGGRPSAQVLPDLSTCAECLRELRDVDDRRHRYPFLNCTGCGPRFSIVQALPYDRPRTTMRDFALCDACRSEYESPVNRRFHAQPTACPRCGPSLELWQPDGTVLAAGDSALLRACREVRDGRVLALKGLGGFQLIVDARNESAVRRLREGKPRRDKPLAVMVRDLAAARALCRLDAREGEELQGPAAPILLLERRPSANLAEAVAPGNPRLGVMLPCTPLHHLLVDTLDFPVVATSGNRSDEPICTDEHEALQRLAGLADVFLVHDRPIARHVDDSVAWCVDGEIQLLRRARGYAPRPVRVGGNERPSVLAVGAHLKNCVALSVGSRVYVSQHIGDMETPQALDAFERVIDDFLRLYEARPVAVAHDLHPDYATTRWAQRADGGHPRLAGLPRIAVQHHHAHLASCLAEHDVSEPVLGATWDGTGYGTDGVIWGGELLLGDAHGFERVAHLAPFRLPGGDAAVLDARRTALALTHPLEATPGVTRAVDARLRSVPAEEQRLWRTMTTRGVASPWTTSAGRLFDGVSALLGLATQNRFEGQAAMALEFAADPGVTDGYPLPLDDGSVPWQLDWRPTVEAVIADLDRGLDVGTIAARFHNALVDALVGIAARVGVQHVALSGGCFQNRRLLSSTVERLRAAGHTPLIQREAPPNDGGIALGQIAVAAAHLASRG